MTRGSGRKNKNKGIPFDLISKHGIEEARAIMEKREMDAKSKKDQKGPGGAEGGVQQGGGEPPNDQTGHPGDPSRSKDLANPNTSSKTEFPALQVGMASPFQNGTPDSSMEVRTSDSDNEEVRRELEKLRKLQESEQEQSQVKARRRERKNQLKLERIHQAQLKVSRRLKAQGKGKRTGYAPDDLGSGGSSGEGSPGDDRSFAQVLKDQGTPENDWKLVQNRKAKAGSTPGSHLAPHSTQGMTVNRLSYPHKTGGLNLPPPTWVTGDQNKGAIPKHPIIPGNAGGGSAAGGLPAAAYVDGRGQNSKQVSFEDGMVPGDGVDPRGVVQKSILKNKLGADVEIEPPNIRKINEIMSFVDDKRRSASSRERSTRGESRRHHYESEHRDYVTPTDSSQSSEEDSPKRKSRKKGKIRSGLKDKPLKTKLKVEARGPAAHINTRFVSADIEISSMRFHEFCAGELETVLDPDTSTQEAYGRLRVLRRLAYHYKPKHAEISNMHEIIDLYSAMLNNIQRGIISWSGDAIVTSLEQDMLAMRLSGKWQEGNKQKKSGNQSNPQNNSQNSEIVYCMDFNTEKGCKYNDRHVNNFKGRQVQRRHICRKCFSEKNKVAYHSQNDPSCPYKSE